MGQTFAKQTSIFGSHDYYNCCHCDHFSGHRPQFIDAESDDPGRGSESMVQRVALGEKLEKSHVEKRSAEAVNSNVVEKPMPTTDREQLQAEVKAFAGCAVDGIDCAIVLHDGPVAARLVLDRGLQKLSVETSAEDPIVVFLGRIEGIYRYEAARNIFPYLVEDLPISDAEQDRAAVLLLGRHKEKETILCLQEKDNKSRERFITGLKILRLYVQTSGGNREGQSPSASGEPSVPPEI